MQVVIVAISTKYLTVLIFRYDQLLGSLKIMLMFCNGQIWIQLGTPDDFWKFKSEKERQQTSMIWRMAQNTN